MSLPYEQVLALVAGTSPSPDVRTIFIVFVDGDVLLSLRLRLDSELGDERVCASEILAFLEGSGVRFFDAGDNRPYLPLPIRETSFDAVPSHNQIASLNGEKLTDTIDPSIEKGPIRDDRFLSSSWAGLKPISEWRPLKSPTRDGASSATKRAIYEQLLIHVRDELVFSDALHEQRLITDDEFASLRKIQICQWNQIHQLIRIAMLYQAGLICEAEYEQVRREAAIGFSRLDSLTNEG
ncbi:MAG: hypothetical protein WBW04_14380 [Nitrolancea sp.]